MYWPPVSAVCENARKKLSPALPVGLWSYQAALSSTLSCTALGSLSNLPNIHTQRLRREFAPLACNNPFCPWCMWNMASLKASPKFRLTFLRAIIIHSHCWKKKNSLFFKFQNILATVLNKVGLLQLVPGLFYSVTDFCPVTTRTRWLPKGTVRSGARQQGAVGTLTKGLKEEAALQPQPMVAPWEWCLL